MADEPFDSVQPSDSLWTVRKPDRYVDCVLCSHGAHVWEVQLFRNGRFFMGRRFKLREHAIQHAEEVKAELLAAGWSVDPLSTE